MSKVTAELVMQLRKRTGVGMAKCKEALAATSGDVESAIDHLRKAGVASAVKKSAREANEGLIGFVEDATHIALVEVNAETDFVIQNERFQAFVKEISELVIAAKPKDLDAFLMHKMDSGHSVEDYRIEQVTSMGENILIKRIHVIEKHSNASYGLYSHMGGKIMTCVEIEGSKDQGDLARDIAMHVAAESPEYLAPEDVPADVKQREEDIAREQMKGKPAEMIDKILAGKLRAFCDQVCLIKQKYVKDPSMSVEKVVAKAGDNLKVTRFFRWQVGE